MMVERTAVVLCMVGAATLELQAQQAIFGPFFAMDVPTLVVWVWRWSA